MVKLIYGRHPIKEALKSKRDLKKIYVAKSLKGKIIESIIHDARKNKVPLKFVEKRQLEKIAGKVNHQGVAGEVSGEIYANMDDVLESVESKSDALIVILDRITDPHNLGAIIRSAHLLGADAIFIPKRNSAGINKTVTKVSAGAVEYLPVVRVINLAQIVDVLKKRGFWIIGADANGKDCSNAKLKGKIALVMGSEGKGMKRLLREKCDVIVSIPISGKIDSLNVSCAAGILMYEIHRQRVK